MRERVQNLLIRLPQEEGFPDLGEMFGFTVDSFASEKGWKEVSIK